ncbi:MAG: hypothetical protein KatS3mg038_2453 [Candidatus Kapaibacterium sp.]|nr:MAG: hypothetical protein KatS3mg038_2453 [Candidatus Kapabacteria bacterium]
MLTAEVRGVKVLEVYRLPPPWELLTLASPLAQSRWEPRRPPEYRARHGIYFWALPTLLLDAWEYMRPVDRYYVVALVRAVPRRRRQLELEPVRSICEPRRIDFGGADVLWHRNYVAIARAVRIERLIVHPDAPGEVVTLCHRYGVPVHVSQCDAITSLRSGHGTRQDATCRAIHGACDCQSTWSHRERPPGRCIARRVGAAGYRAGGGGDSRRD